MSNLDPLSFDSPGPEALPPDTLADFIEEFMADIRDTQEQVHQYVFHDFNGFEVILCVSLVSISPVEGVFN